MNYVKNNTNRVPEILLKHFKIQTQKAPEIVSNYFKNRTQEVPEIFSDYLKNKTWLSEFFQTTLKTRYKKSPNFYIPQKSNARGLRDPLKQLQNQNKRGPRDSFKVLQKLDTRGLQNFVKVLQKQNKRSPRNVFRLLQKPDTGELRDSFKLLLRQDITGSSGLGHLEIGKLSEALMFESKFYRSTFK